MKKLICVLLMLCLAILPAMGEGAEIRWKDMTGELEARGLEGDFASAASTGLKLWLPDGAFEEKAVTDKQAMLDIVSVFEGAEGKITVAQEYTELDGAGRASELEGDGCVEVAVCRINNIPAVTWLSESDDVRSAELYLTSTVVVRFDFEPASDADFDALAQLIIASIQRD